VARLLGGDRQRGVVLGVAHRLAVREAHRGSPAGRGAGYAIQPRRTKPWIGWRARSSSSRKIRTSAAPATKPPTCAQKATPPPGRPKLEAPPSSWSRNQ